MRKRSEDSFDKALKIIPGGVNSPVRAFNGVGHTPVFFKSANGPYLYDVDDNEYIDYVGAWGPMILGHRHPKVIEALSNALETGLAFGAPTDIETELATRVCQLMPNLEQVRMVNSGTEATMTAIRLARGITNKDMIIKFTGCYHGHVDSLLVNAGSGALTLGQPSSPGIPSALANLTLSLDFNDEAQVIQAFEKHHDKIAAVIVEPIAGNMNLIPGTQSFIQTLRDCCTKHGSLLIFDEVMTGFRVAKGGAQSLYNIVPDITALGKVIGGGLPVGALGGKKEIMTQLAPTGPIYQAGTLSGNPLAMAAGLATLTAIDNDGYFDALTNQCTLLTEGLSNVANELNIPFSARAIGGMFGLFFSEQPAHNFKQTTQCNIQQFKQFFHAMLSQGVYLAPSAFEAGFISSSHNSMHIEHTLEAAKVAFSQLH